MKLLLEFEAIFPDEQSRKPAEYLKGGSRHTILNVCAFFLGFKNHGSKYERPKDFLSMLFRQENGSIGDQILSKIEAQERAINKKIIITNPYSSLKLFELFFQTNNEEETQSAAEFEVNLFKAYLTLNSDFTKRQLLAGESTKELDIELKLPMMRFCADYPYSDKFNYNLYGLWITQTIKAILLFQFLANNDQTKTLLVSFLDHFQCKTWEEYLKRLLPLTMSAIEASKEAHIDINVNHDENFEGNCSFVEKLIILDDDPLEENDFLSLRAKPFYKIEPGKYRVIFNLFVVEKIFKGVYFLLRDVNARQPINDRISDLKSLFGNDFSENVLLYQVIKSIYPNNCLQFSGQELKDKGISAEPDYYVRKGKDILLFESKDFLIPAKAKESFDFFTYESEFEKKLYFEEVKGKQNHKAVMQLIGNVKRVLKKAFEADKDYFYREVTIYPILVTHDHQYDTTGFNNLIDYWFQAEVEILREEGYFTNKIQPLVVVNIDAIIYHQIALQKNFALHKVLKAYINYVRIRKGIKFPTKEEAEDYVLSKLTPFSVFMDKFFIRNNVKVEIPALIQDLKLALFKDDLAIDPTASP
ncbi:MAG: hypothetical protein WC760_06985 [Bacteroidia bacterium]